MASTVNGSYTISFNANGGSGAPSTLSGTYSALAGDQVPVTLPSTTPSKSGYSFKGWSTDSGASTASYFAGGTFSFSAIPSTPNRSFTMYAVYGASASSISVSGDGILNHSQGITINRANSSFKHTVTYSWAGATGTIADKTSSTTISWTPPLSLATNLPNASSAVCTLTCKTYDGGTYIGQKTTTITLWVAGYQKLKIDTVTVSDTVAAVYNNFDSYVQGRSKVKFVTTLDSDDAYGATLQSCVVSFNNQSLSGTTVTSNIVQNYGNVPYTVTITDSRGRTDTSSGTLSVYQYSAPVASISTLTRVDGTPTSATVSYAWSISSVGDQNTKQVKVKYKLVSAASYTTATTATPDDYIGNDTYTITGLASSEAYDVLVEVKDVFATVTYAAQILAEGNRYIECSADDGTISFNGANPEDGWNHFYKPTWFNEDVHLEIPIATSTVSGGLLFDCGTVSERSVASASYDSVSVLFTTAFPVVPVVILTLSSSLMPNVGNCTASLVSVSESGFTVKLNNAASAARTIGAHWFAVANGRNSNLVGYGVVGTMSVG